MFSWMIMITDRINQTSDEIVPKVKRSERSELQALNLEALRRRR